MKLNIGSGKRPYTGYKTIDIEPDNKPDIVGDFRTMTFEDVEEIRAEHILEHFSREESFEVLMLWKRWLKPGGKMIIETPDVEGICAAFADADAGRRYWLTRHLYGSQEADWAFHRDGWYESKFKGVCTDLGLKLLEVHKGVSRGYLPNIKVVIQKP